MTEEEVATLSRCLAVGGVAIFPTDTVYGVGTEPDSREGLRRLYRLKGRPPDRPAAVMFFDLDLAFSALPELGARTREALRRLLPGALTLLLPNPEHRFPLACGPHPERVGVRVPALPGGLAPLAGLRWPVLQSSANRSGGPDARRLGDVDARIRRGVDLELDGGELLGTSSTVLDLTGFEDGGEWSVVREGAVLREQVEDALSRPRG